MSDFELMLTADSRGLVSGERALDSIASTAERTQTRAGKALEHVGKAANDVGKQSVFASQQMRMTSMQLSQVAQQASATGDWLQAIAIQLPDLALGLGPIGILAGAAAGALLPLAANLIMTQEEAEELADKIGDLEKATDAYEKAVANASMSGSDLVEKFGAQAKGAQEVYDVLRQIAELDYYKKLSEAQAAIGSAMSDLQSSVERVQSATKNFFPEDAIMVAQQEVQFLNREFGLTLIQANSINNALDDLAAAKGPQEAAAAAKEFSEAIKQAEAEGAKISPQMKEVQKQALLTYLDTSRFTNMLGQANGAAATLEGTMSGVADQAARAASIFQAMAAAGGAITAKYPSQGAYDGIIRTGDGPIQGSSDPDLPFNGPVPTPRGTPELSGFPWENFGSRRRGGGGRSPAMKALQDDQREAQRIFEDTRTEAEKYEKEMEKLDDLHSRGFINADTYSRAVKQLGDDFKDTGESARFLEDINEDLKEGILDAIVEGENLGDVFEDLAKKIAKAALEAALFGTGPFAQGGGKSGGGGLGGFLGGFLGKLFSFDGGGYTGDGARSGGLDGKGGYLAMIHPQESVVDHTKGGSTGGAMRVTFAVDADSNGNLMPFVTSVARSEAGGLVGKYDKQLPGRVKDVMERNAV
ncbi:hypothetical protein JZX87_10095 [Agrobacterium sp. Ap1]|uniref:hypothetical protein n=1 Tax=Agrobacterium sp. Ap1 TaxID=2815337 RepID=UPI001A8E70D3|nr:hypothetical protein [Agrobacterium sp. Ap1]MBO0141513.1 hypothetical protein [Agrobacterium sp. Ap1]